MASPEYPDPSLKSDPEDSAAEGASAVPTLLRLCRPHARSFVLIGILAALGSVAAVVAPLIYRTAVNDLSGLFVHQTYEEFRDESEPPTVTSES